MAAAARLRWRAPELALLMADQASSAAAAIGAEAVRLRAEVLAVFACNQLGRGASAGGRAVRALRAAQGVGQEATERLIRVELAACAADALAPAVGLAVLRPVFARVSPAAPTARAAAMVTAADCLARLGGGPDVAALLTGADQLYDTSRAVEPDAVLLRRGVVHGRLAAYHRRVGDHTAAEATAREGLRLVEELTDADLDTGQVSGVLTLELVLAMLGAGRSAEAVLAAQPVLRRPSRPAGAPAACWLRLALVSQVHLQAGRHALARRLLADAAADAERHQLDLVLAECRQLQAQLYETCAEVGEALHSVRLAHVADRRWRETAGELRTLLAAEFGAPPPASELRAGLAAVLSTARPAEGPTSRPVDLITRSRHSAPTPLPLAKTPPPSADLSAAPTSGAPPAEPPVLTGPSVSHPRAASDLSESRAVTDLSGLQSRAASDLSESRVVADLSGLQSRAATDLPGSHPWAAADLPGLQSRGATDLSGSSPAAVAGPSVPLARDASEPTAGWRATALSGADETPGDQPPAYLDSSASPEDQLQSTDRPAADGLPASADLLGPAAFASSQADQPPAEMGSAVASAAATDTSMPTPFVAGNVGESSHDQPAAMAGLPAPSGFGAEEPVADEPKDTSDPQEEAASARGADERIVGQLSATVRRYLAAIPDGVGAATAGLAADVGDGPLPRRAGWRIRAGAAYGMTRGSGTDDQVISRRSGSIEGPRPDEPAPAITGLDVAGDVLTWRGGRRGDVSEPTAEVGEVRSEPEAWATGGTDSAESGADTPVAGAPTAAREAGLSEAMIARDVAGVRGADTDEAGALHMAGAHEVGGLGVAGADEVGGVEAVVAREVPGANDAMVAREVADTRDAGVGGSGAGGVSLGEAVVAGGLGAGEADAREVTGTRDAAADEPGVSEAGTGEVAGAGGVGAGEVAGVGGLGAGESAACEADGTGAGEVAGRGGFAADGADAGEVAGAGGLGAGESAACEAETGAGEVAGRGGFAADGADAGEKAGAGGLGAGESAAYEAETGAGEVMGAGGAGAGQVGAGDAGAGEVTDASGTGARHVGAGEIGAGEAGAAEPGGTGWGERDGEGLGAGSGGVPAEEAHGGGVNGVERGSGRHRSDVAMADLLAEALLAYQNGRRSQIEEIAPKQSVPAETPRVRLMDLPREQVWREPGWDGLG